MISRKLRARTGCSDSYINGDLANPRFLLGGERSRHVQAAREDSGRLRDAPDAISSSVERFACAISSQISAGMLSRWSHERIVVIGRPVSDAMWS